MLPIQRKSRSISQQREAGMTATPTAALPSLVSHEKMQLLLCFVGVVGSLLIYGVLQERVMTMPFVNADGESERFGYSLFLVLCNRAVTCLVAAVSLLVSGRREELRPVAPIYSYAGVSLSNVAATTCQYEALKWVSFAVQTLGKCAKMFPVMIWGFLMLGKRYSVKEVALAVTITSGCFIFFMTGNTASRVAKGSPNSSMYGVALMLGYLGADGFTSTVQDQMFKGYQMTTYNQVLYVSLCSMVFSSAGLVTSGQLSLALAFLARHPDALLSILLLSCAATAGSLCISYTIKSFGALIFAMIMTTRQLLSIVLSSLLFSNPMTLGQWGGTAVVFMSLYYQTVTKQHRGKGKGEKEATLPTSAQTDDAAADVAAGETKPLLSDAGDEVVK